MKKFLIIGLCVLIFLLVLFFPFKQETLNDGGTKVYTALTYKRVLWNRTYDYSLYTDNPQIYKGKTVYWFPENFTDMDLILEREEEDFFKNFEAPGFGNNTSLQTSKKDIFSDESKLTISYDGVDFDSDNPGIKILWKNSSTGEKGICPYDYDILYCPTRGERDIEKYKSCAVKPRIIFSLAMLIPAEKETPDKFSVTDFDLSENTGEYCLMIRTAEMQDSEDRFVKMFFTLSE